MPQDTSTEAAPEHERSSRLKSFGFLLRFAIILAVLYIPLLAEPVDRTVVEPFTRGIAIVSGGILNAMGQGVTRTGTALAAGPYAVSIKNGCNGLEAMAFLLAAILAFAAPWKKRLAAAAFGVVLVQGLNLIRVVSLFLIQRYYPSLFELFHLAIWQTIIGGASIGFFYVWTLRVTTSAHAPEHA